MSNFLGPVLIVSVIFVTFYGVIELFVRRKERLSIIEKLGDKLDPSMINNKFILPSYMPKSGSFATLKIACLLIGLGLGFLIGVIFDLSIIQQTDIVDHIARDMRSMVYTASVLVFGGLGLLVSFLIERNAVKKDKEK